MSDVYDALLSDPAAAPAKVACPNCRALQPLYDPAHSCYFGCPRCGCYFRLDPAGPQSTQRLAALGAPGAAPPLRLGATGRLGGYELRVVGAQLRSEKKDQTARWREYQLRPVRPVSPAPADLPLQLAEYQGHWLLIRRAKSFPVNRNGRRFMQQRFTDLDSGLHFKLWHRYTPQIEEAQGEFDWNLADDEKLEVQEYIAPPYLLTSEQAPGEKQVWYLGQYLEPAEVAAAFGLSAADLPDRLGVGAAQPAPFEAAWKGLGMLLLLGLSGLVLLQVALLGIHPATVVLDQSFELPNPVAYRDTLVARKLRAELRALNDSVLSHHYHPGRQDDALQQLVALGPLAGDRAALNARYPTEATAPIPQKMLVSKSFTLPARAALDVSLEAPGLDNAWVEVTASLVNEQTGQGYEATRSLEYYSGYEGGESWREGDREASFVLAAVPAGRYHLNLYPSPDPDHPAPPLLQVRAESQPPLWSNFWLAALALGVVPLGIWALRALHESSRWSQSDYGPNNS